MDIKFSDIEDAFLFTPQISTVVGWVETVCPMLDFVPQSNLRYLSAVMPVRVRAKPNMDFALFWVIGPMIYSFFSCTKSSLCPVIIRAKSV